MQGDGCLRVARLPAKETRHERAARRHPHAGDVEPADLRRRGAGEDAAAHGLLHRVREAGDLSAGVFDPQGRMLAQAVTGTPGHVNTMAEAVAAFHRRHRAGRDVRGRHLHHQRPVEGHRPSARHHHGLAVVPRRRTGRLSSPARRMSSTSAAAASARMASRVYEEGHSDPDHEVRARRGQPRPRPHRAQQCARDRPGGGRLLFARRLQRGRPSPAGRHAGRDRPRSTRRLGAFILSRSRQATIERIAALPKGSWSNSSDRRLRRAGRAGGRR